MKKVLILGAGMVVRPMVNYLLDNNYQVTVASRTKSKAEALTHHHPNGKAIGWTVDQGELLDQMIADHDLTVSLLPYTYHVMVAKKCIKHRKNMVTTSYVKPEMKALDRDARQAGIIILNEIGVDPGIDHMSAMRIIDHIHGKNGKVESFYSCTGALVAPEVEKNPFNYKFTWAPKGVVMAGKNDGKYLKDGKVIKVHTNDLFKHPLITRIEGVGVVEIYPNRDSLPYIDLYGIPEAKTMYRGTIRYTNWCQIMDAFKKLDLLSYEKIDMQDMRFADLLAHQIDSDNSLNIKVQVAHYLNLNINSIEIKAMDWLGLFSEEKINRKSDSPFEVVSDLMISKMMIRESERDMVIMQHSFVAVYTDGKKELIRSKLLDFGSPETDTSIARTVALPAACAADMILNDQIKVIGVHIPVIPEIYNPVLNRLEKLGIKMEEQFGLPVGKEII